MVHYLGFLRKGSGEAHHVGLCLMPTNLGNSEQTLLLELEVAVLLVCLLSDSPSSDALNSHKYNTRSFFAGIQHWDKIFHKSCILPYFEVEVKLVVVEVGL